ncbi:MAG: hypothetical protein ABL982_08605 [Vicinamibacterales bacterium]
MKSTTGDTARLLNISRTGALLETTARLQPGRRSTIAIVSADDERERAEGTVLRTELVSIGPNGEMIYRTAMVFTNELDLRLPESSPAAMHETVVEAFAHPELEGPLQGLWATASGASRVLVSHLTPVSCYVQPTSNVRFDEWVSVTVFFSPVRALTLSGKVAAVEPHGCLLRFENLSPDVRRALRVEIREGSTEHGQATALPAFSVGSLTDVSVDGPGVIEWHAQAGALHANQW